MWTDSHCHLQYDGVDADAVEAARAAGVTRLICVGTDAAYSRAAISAAAAHEGVWATAGLHPHDATAGLEGVVELLGEPKVVAVGECGLDYHYEHSPREVQREVFAEQLGLARTHDLALVVHTRSAWDDTFAILEAGPPPERTILHCFSGGVAEARRALDLGAHLSFSGIVTFKNAADVRAAATFCPLDRLLVETDAPYLAPVPHRGQANAPAFVPLVGAAVAEARGVEVGVVEVATWDAAQSVFRLPQT